MHKDVSVFINFVSLIGNYRVVRLEVKVAIVINLILLLLENIIANLLHNFVIAKQVNQHFLVTGLELLNVDGRQLRNLNFVSSDFE